VLGGKVWWIERYRYGGNEKRWVGGCGRYEVAVGRFVCGRYSRSV
jgi:hypothetical protein